jgi:hypothetical protein
MDSLASRMIVNQAKMASNLEEIKAGKERMIGKMEAWLRNMEANPEKL